MTSSPDYVLSRNVVFRREGRAGIIFRPDTGEIEPMNETAAFILSCVERKLAVERIADELAAAFEAGGVEEAAGDVREFLSEMERRGVVVRA